MFASLGRAFALFVDPALFGVVVKSLLLTIALFVLLAMAAEYALHLLPTLGAPWVNRMLEILAPVLFVLGFFLLGGPVAALFATLYLDEIAAAIEARFYAADPRALGTSFRTALAAGLRLAGLVVAVDLVLLPADILLPGLAEVSTIVANGFLLGREYFELAALRHLSLSAAGALRRRNAGRVFLAGLIVSMMTAVPIANLFAPLFGAALMVHLYKRSAQEARA